MISVARNLTQGASWVRDGQWKASSGNRFFGTDLFGKTIGILGLGGIGQAIARRAAGFSMNIIYHNRRRLGHAVESASRAIYRTKDELLNESDFVVLALPFTKENYHLIGERELNNMRPHAILINIARGGLIDELALARALRENRIAGAGLDVFETEPNIPSALLNLPNVLLTPHIAGATLQTQHALVDMAADNIIAALGHGPFANHPPSILNPEVMNP
jgi:lactate dehydrogenase-like 2-hydroxyacid dehydrogenase